MSASTLCSSCLQTLRRQQQVKHSKSLIPPFSTQRALAHSIQSVQKPQTHQATKVAAHNAPLSGNRSARHDALPPQPESTKQSLFDRLRNRKPDFKETYVAYGACELLVKECARIADYSIPQAAKPEEEIPKSEKGEDVGIGKGWWYEELGLLPTFNNWAQVTFLHMWCLTVRLRMFPQASARWWHQHLTDHFFYLAEDRMVTMHRLHSSMVRKRFLRDLFHQYRGMTAAYDVGLVKGDPQLASAIWRNLCGANPDVDLRRLAQVVSYTRSVLHNLEKMDDFTVGRADVIFGDPAEEEELVRQRSKLMDVKFETAKKPIQAGKGG